MPAANTNINGNAQALTVPRKRKLIGPALGSAFDPDDRLFQSYGHGGVFDYGYAEAKDLQKMISEDGKARAIEQVLTLPLRGADHEITGPNKEFVEDSIPNLDLIIDQMTSATVFRKAYFEKVWKYENGRLVYNKLAFRPAVSCSAWYHEETGDLLGFRQRTRINITKIHRRGRNMAWARNQNRGFNKVKDEPGWVYIPIEKAFIYVHGLHRDPVRGISDMDVAYWAYETRKKVQFLWFQFLENVALPRMVVYGDDQEEANERASLYAAMKSSGALGLAYDRQGRPGHEVIDSSGQGAAQFEAAVNYLESMMTQSVLASFMDLPTNSTGTGSYALSADQSEFFLTSRQAVADEIAQCINRNLIGPLINYNYGDVELPKIEIGPLSNRTTERALALLTAIIAAPQMNVPVDFVGTLVKYTANYLGLDEEQVVEQVDEYTEKRKHDDEEQRVALLKQQQAAASMAAQGPGIPGGNLKGSKKEIAGTGVDNKERSRKARAGRAKSKATKLALDSEDTQLVRAAVDAAYDLVQLAESGIDPEDLV